MKRIAVLSIVTMLSSILFAQDYDVTYDFVGSTPIYASQVNQNFQDLVDASNDLKTQIETMAVGLWNEGAGGAIYYNGGYIGVGTGSPAIELDTVGTIRALSAPFNPPSSGTGVEIFYASNEGPRGVIVAYDRGTAEVKTLDIVGNPVTLTGGNVGIGVFPSYNLDVIGDINFSGNIYQNGSLFSGGGGNYWTQSGSDIYYDSGNVGVGTTNPSEKLFIDGNMAIDNGNIVVNGSSTSNWIGFYNGYYIPWDDPTLSSHMNSGKDISINIDFNNNNTDGRFAIFTNGLNSTGTELLRVQENGNIGIGTTSPYKLLDVRSTATGDFALAVRGDIDHDGNWTGIRFGYDWIGGDVHQKFGIIAQGTDTSARGKLHFALEGTADGSNVDISDTKMTIDFNGNVGIGTTNPNYKLDVAGDINTSGDIRKSGAAYNNPDYVFAPEYNLMSFDNLNSYLEENNHLPGMPSTEEIQQTDVLLFEQNRLLLEKIEESYLYILQLEERISRLEESQ